MASVGVKEFLTKIAKSGGMAYSNTYEVKFQTPGATLNQELQKAGFNAGKDAEEMFTLLCEEASLPGMMASTGQTTGRYLGEGQVNYAHTKMFQELTLGWTCDANLTPLRYLNAWMRAIFNEKNGAADAQPGRYTTTRLNYPNDYMCRTMTIIKGERNAGDTLGRVAGKYTFNEVWPYSIVSTPVSYGSSTLLKVSASFHYRNWAFEGYSPN